MLDYTPPSSTEHSHVNGTVHARCTIRPQSRSSLTCTSTERAVDPSVIVVRRVARKGLSCTHAIGRCRTLSTHDVLCPNLRSWTTKLFPVHDTANYSGSRQNGEGFGRLEVGEEGQREIKHSYSLSPHDADSRAPSGSPANGAGANCNNT